MKRRTRTKVKPAVKDYRVFVEQVNRIVVQVKATSPDEASELGYKKWKKEHAHTYVSAVEEVCDE